MLCIQVFEKQKIVVNLLDSFHITAFTFIEKHNWWEIRWNNEFEIKSNDRLDVSSKSEETNRQIKVYKGQ